jgi:tetratricopeptide (TPR) repeat protein
MNLDKYDLISRSKEELVRLLGILMDKLPEEERLRFISKWISPEAALEESGMGDSASLLKRAESLCAKCLDGEFSLETDFETLYDFAYDDRGVYDFEESEWAEAFATLLKQSVMYARNKDYNVSYTALDTLLGCLHEAEEDIEILGTDYPLEFIEVDWDDVFEAYALSIRNCLKDEEEAYEEAVDVWVDFGSRFTNHLMNEFDDLQRIEEAIRKGIAKYKDQWLIQHRLYELLKGIYKNHGIRFDEVSITKSLVRFNPNFRNDVAEGLVHDGKWEEAVETIQKAKKVITDAHIVVSLDTKLADCYGNLGRFKEAYDIAVRMFLDLGTHEMYLRARNFALEVDTLNKFIDTTERSLLSSGRFQAKFILLRIFSYEGLTSRLVDTALKSDGYERYNYLKYTARSLVYRAVGSKKVQFPDLKGFLKAIEAEEITGIVDMLRTKEDPENEQSQLRSAIEIMKMMVQFHIDAALRPRYAKAAYYCAVIRDIFAYLNEEDQFEQYYDEILRKNSKRPALKDEMQKKLR